MKKTKQRRSRSAIRLDRFLPYRMTLLAYRLSADNGDLEAHGHRLTLQEWRVLSIVADLGPLAPAEVRRHGTQDKSTISWAIKRLQGRGLLKRNHRVNDGRTFEVSLSVAGRAYYTVVARAAEKKARRILRALSPREIKELWRLIDKLDGGRSLGGDIRPD